MPSTGSAAPRTEEEFEEGRRDPRPTIGRIVHFVRKKDEWTTAVSRPAIIVDVLTDTMVQLQVFNDGDGGPAYDGLPNVTWETSVEYNPDCYPGTWHWPKRS